MVATDRYAHVTGIHLLLMIIKIYRYIRPSVHEDLILLETAGTVAVPAQVELLQWFHGRFRCGTDSLKQMPLKTT